MEETKIEDMFNRYFNTKISGSLKKVKKLIELQEIRMRSNRPLSVVIGGKELLVTENGELLENSSFKVLITSEDIDYTFKAICDYSVHSYTKDICEGFITIEGGHRIGICGTALFKNSEIENIKYISGLNIRIAKEIKGSADKIIKMIDFNKGGILIAGPPCSGKTTVLRDLCRQLGTKSKVSVIDERGEIAGVYRGIAQNDIGIFTDVFNGYPKETGILMALKVMSPQYIITDEIGSEKDCEAIEKAVFGGSTIIATVHAGDFCELKKRKYIVPLLEMGVFKYIFFLGTNRNLGQIKELIEVKDIENCRNDICDYCNHLNGDSIFKKSIRESKDT